MTIDDLSIYIRDRYGVKADELADIVRWASGYSDQDRSRIWAKFKETWKLASPPRQAHFYEIANEIGVKRGGTSGKKYEYECAAVIRAPDVLCKTRFPAPESTNCPRCGATTHSAYVVRQRGDHERY